MKKITALILSLVMVLSLTTTAFAATLGNPGNQDIDVKAKYQSSATTATVYSVDVAWGAMEFTYTESGTRIWDPADHSYTDTTTAWTASGNTVTVTNHSNAPVTASFAFAPLTDYEVTGSFDVATQSLAAGVEGDYAGAAKVVSTLTLASALSDTVTDFTKVGTITVTIA